MDALRRPGNWMLVSCPVVAPPGESSHGSEGRARADLPRPASGLAWTHRRGPWIDIQPARAFEPANAALQRSLAPTLAEALAGAGFSTYWYDFDWPLAERWFRADFNFTPAANPDPDNFNPGANDVAPFKRPRSSMVPTMIFDGSGRPLIAYGSPGGSTIINSVFNVTLNLIDHRMTLQDAIDAPRLSRTATADSGAVSVDSGAPDGRFSGFDPGVLDALRALGHTVSEGSGIGSVQGVYVEPGTGKQYGAADSRREGTVIGLPRPRGR